MIAQITRTTTIPYFIRILNNRHNGRRQRIRRDIQKYDINLFLAKKGSSFIGSGGIVHKAGINERDIACRLDLITDTALIAFKALLESGELGPIGIKTDPE